MNLFFDARYAIRSLARTPRFTMMAVLTLALGIGTNVAIFSVVNGALVHLTGELTKTGATDIGTGRIELDDFRTRAGVFESVAGVYPVNANLTEVADPERVEGALVSGNYFTVLGVDPQLGRLFSQADEIPGNAPLVVISDSLWRRRFGGSPNVLGRTVRLDEDPYEIIGVLPASFHHPGRGIVGEPEFFSPAGYRGTPYGTPRRGIFGIPGGRSTRRRSVSTRSARICAVRIRATILTRRAGGRG